METKKCNCCQEDKTLAEFAKDKSRKDGYNYRCKTCFSKASKKHRLNNPQYKEEQSKRGKNYYKLNKEKCLTQSKEWREANPEEFKQAVKNWGTKNPHKIKEYGKKWHKINLIYSA